MKLTIATVTMMLAYLGVEPREGDQPDQLLDSTLDERGLTRDQFVTGANMFAMGYHRGLAGESFGDDQVPVGEDGKPDDELMRAVEDGYAIGLEARDLKLTPTPSLAFQAWRDGLIKPGGVARWAEGVSLQGTGARLVHAVTVGSGKSARVVPAGTPVDLIGELEKDGVKHLLLGYDGAALIVPSPDDSPAVVDVSSQVVPTRKARAASEKGAKQAKSSNGAAAPRERGPSLRDAIAHVIEGQDGGPGPLASNGEIASRVLARAREIGVGDKAGTFVREADRHVPYYLNCYKPTKADDGTITGPGRMGVMNPVVGTLARIDARKYYLRAPGDHDAKLAAVPKELVEQFDDAGTLTVPVAKAAEKAPEKSA